MRRTYVYFIRGREHEWGANIELNSDAAGDMIADGVELGELYYTIPDWIVYAGFSRPWMFCADIFHFRNPFAS